MLLLFLFVIGLSIGSFLNVLIDRLPKGEGLMGRSYCDHCKKPIAAWDLVPVLSFLYLNGKCRNCGKKINPRYTFIELLTGALFVLTFLYLPVDSVTLRLVYLGIVSCLIVVFFSDLKFQIIPDRIQFAFLVFTVVVLFLEGFNGGGIILRVLEGFLIASPLSFIFLFTKGKGMGFADIKFALVMGMLLGLQAGFIALYLAFIAGSIWGLLLIALKMKKFRSKVAFGPFLVIGTLISIFFFKQISDFLHLYLG